MRLVSLDIDPHNRANRIHLGPFVSGLNAVWGPRGAGKSTIAKFIRGLLYHRHRDASGYGQDAVDGLVGSLQWADNAGNTRVISSADAVNERDYQFAGPYYYGQQKSSLEGAAYPDTSSSDQPWHRIGGEVYDAVFCGRLGETLPERLWQAARELGIHVATGNEQDETYRRLKAEEYRLQQRLHHLRVDDRDRVWWSAERERLAARLNELAMLPEIHALPIAGTKSSIPVNLSASPVSALQYREWESQLVQHRAEQSELLAREAELSRQLVARRSGAIPSTIPTYEGSFAEPVSNGRYARSSNLHRDHYGTWVGYAKPPRQVRDYGWVGSENTAPASVESLEADHLTVRNRMAHLGRLIDDLESKLANRRSVISDRATSAWEAEELRSRLSYAEEVLKSWDLYEQTRRRLAEVQAQLQGHGPYHEAVRGSFLQCVERYVRELSAGALRRLPTWALEALRRDLGYAAGLSNQGRLESYREVYRDYRADTKKIDYPVPPSQSSERQLVELAIRMAILESAAHRIGRLPLILDDALDGFHGQTLDHVVRVLIEFARQGQQVLLMTSEQEVAERVRVHHGWVAHLQHGPTESESRIAAPIVYREPVYAPQWTPSLRPVAYDDYAPNLAELNAQLSAAAANPFETAAHAPRPVAVPDIYRYADYPRPVPARAPSVPSTAGRFFLSERSRIEDAPGMNSVLGKGARSLGIETVGQWIATDPHWVADHLGPSITSIEAIVARQTEARLMCGVPQLRAFDARVLVGCGIRTPQTLAQMHPGRLLSTVEAFLTTPAGQEILRSGTSYELSRITTWIASARRSLYRDETGERRERIRSRDERRSARRNSSRKNFSSRPGERRSRSSDGREYATPLSKPAFVAMQVDTDPVSHTTSQTSSHRFYLELDSQIVDAPSIGPRMAERLNVQGIRSVRDFLNASAQTVANQLTDKRITPGTILDWQRQAMMVCRIPNLRGHDAQMLVACGVTTPEQLLTMDATDLHASVSAFASSKAGQRVLRGAAGADLDEVKHWIAWSQQSRTLRAA
jgi:energy-coupling factor transporter ATP-binding protein EcfA2